MIWYFKELKMKHWKSVAMVLGILTILATVNIEIAPAAPWQGSQNQDSGFLRIKNPEDPMFPLELAKPRELWRAGGDDYGEDEILGFITDVEIDQEGTCYLLHSTLNLINVYSAEGEYLRRIGGEGEGPGEFRNASEFMLMPDGTFGVLQPMPAKVVTLDRQGIPGSYFSLCNGSRGLSLVEKAQAAGEHLAIGMACANYEAGGVDYILSFVDSDGIPLQVIRQETEVDPHGNINIGGSHDKEYIRHWSLAADGRIYVSPLEDRYLFEVYNPRGELERVVERKYKTIKRSDEDLAVDKKRQEEMNERFGGMVQLMSREYERDISEIHCRPGGELWISSSQGRRDCPEGTIGLFDVFDSEGRFHHQIGLLVDYNPKKDDYLLVEDRLFILKQAKVRPASVSSSTSGGVSTMVITSGGGEEEEEDEGDAVPPSVICYELP
jgi:hypothetical protein